MLTSYERLQYSNVFDILVPQFSWNVGTNPKQAGAVLLAGFLFICMGLASFSVSTIFYKVCVSRDLLMKFLRLFIEMTETKHVISSRAHMLPCVSSMSLTGFFLFDELYLLLQMSFHAELFKNAWWTREPPKRRRVYWFFFFFVRKPNKTSIRVISEHETWTSCLDRICVSRKAE